MNYFLSILLLLLIIYFVSYSRKSILHEGMDGEEESDEIDEVEDNDPMKADYTKQIKTPKELGFLIKERINH